MAMACTQSSVEVIGVGGRPVRVYSWDWVSNASGAVDSTVQTTPPLVSGEILKAVFIPGSPAPTDNYDVTITDTDSMDVLAGQGADRSTNTKQSVAPGVPLKDGTTTSVGPMVVNSTLTLNVTNAGDSKAGTVRIYVR